MKYKLSVVGIGEVGWVIQSEDLLLTIRCKSFEVSVPTKTNFEGSKAWLEFETNNNIIIQGNKVIIY